MVDLQFTWLDAVYRQVCIVTCLVSQVCYMGRYQGVLIWGQILKHTFL